MAVTVSLNDIYISKGVIIHLGLWRQPKQQSAIAGKIGAALRPWMVQIAPDNHVDDSESWLWRRSSTRVRIKAFKDSV